MITLLIAAFVVALSPQAPDAVSGTVVDNETKATIPAARVLLARIDGPITESIVVRADSHGRFSVAAVPPGLYRVAAVHPDYLRGDAGQIAVAAGQPAVVAIPLVPTGIITGRVVDEHGDPARKVIVRARAPNVSIEARTNDLGEYRLFGLPPAAYVLSADAPPCPACRITGGKQSVAMLGSGESLNWRALSGRSYPTVYYQGTTQRDEARYIELRAGAQLHGIDFRLIAR